MDEEGSVADAPQPLAGAEGGEEVSFSAAESEGGGGCGELVGLLPAPTQPSTVISAARNAATRVVRFTRHHIVEALLNDVPAVNVPRWFTDHPWYDEVNGRTYVLYRMWGRDTEPARATLVAAFPDATLTFRAADDGD